MQAALFLLSILFGGVASYVVNLIFAARSVPRSINLEGEWIGVYQAPRQGFAWVRESVKIRRQRQSYFFTTSENPDGDTIEARVLGGTEHYLVGEWWSARFGSAARGGFVLMVDTHATIMYGVASHSLSTGYFHGGWILARKNSATLEEDLRKAAALLAALNRPLVRGLEGLPKRPLKGGLTPPKSP